ncbi:MULTISPECIES: sucrose-specific PTS transporter subunit IIBC [Vagococcus]|uniref:protein-N(pi)-phosphohistidine--sucrose phosphotransferase n=1 Tax=Vagococcus fluvialis bH819 TaxID=1255619 RepID=A0A1X6WJP4_9ENTE|nr:MULTISPECIES: sucrose-specific PTS transporter subunit IIBC [Vagococcus]SLM84504.1 PTS system, sucrose-specific IIB component / PTS system, sucrose-specific IIC component / PTS system, sucrose-specific IIA component [Vagococcus fluvialis bH819]HCM90542.1 PTS beta-glucoside transporter subunit IIBCA [Vagococcus sp.]
MNHKKVAQEIQKALGEDNLVGAAHCATRLRLVVRDKKLIKQKELDDNEDVKGTFEANGQYQIIIGPGDVDKVYKELVSLTGVKEASTDDLKEIANSSGKKPNPFMQLIKVLSDIFVPIVPALVAGGLLMAINNVLTSQGLFGPQSVVEMYPAIKDLASIINLLSAAPFAFLPILVGFSATKRFGGNPYLGAAMGMAMVMPDLVNGYGVANAISEGTMPYWNVFGLNIAQAGYQGSVLPVLAVAFILANLEKFFHKHISKALDFTFTPMLSLIITGFLTFAIVGPFMRGVSDGLTDSLVWLYESTGAFGMGVFGTFYSTIVITGLHQSFPAIETTLLADVAKTGGSFIFPVASMANVAQGGAALAVFFLTKSEKQKSLASSASLSAMLGITEPAIFGVNLKLKYPFICAMIASGIASAFIGFFHVLATAMGPASVIGFISIATSSIPMFMIGIVISIIISFTLTFMYGKKKMKKDTTEEELMKSAVDRETVYAPVPGEIIELKNVADPVFSSEAMGKGVAIIPRKGEIIAPLNGVITALYESKHAYGMVTDSGIELLIHIGIDTVSMSGDGFESFVSKGQHVAQGEKISTFDIEKIKKNDLDPTVMLIVTNTSEYETISVLNHGNINQNQAVLAVSK